MSLDKYTQFIFRASLLQGCRFVPSDIFGNSKCTDEKKRWIQIFSVSGFVSF